MRRIYAGGSAVVIVVAALVAIVYLLRGVLLAPLVERFVEERLQTELGLETKVESVGGTYLTSLEIDGLRTVGAGRTGPIEELGCKRLRIEYSPLALLEGWRGFLAKTTVYLEGGVLVVRPRHGPKGAEPSTGPSPQLPPLLPRVRVRDTSVSVRGDGYRLDLAGAALDARPGPKGATEIALRVGKVAWSLAGLRQGEAPVGADLTYADKALHIRRVTVGGSPVVETGRIDLGGLPGELALEAGLKVFGGTEQVGAKVDGSNLELRWKIEGLSVGKALAVTTLSPFFRGGALDSTGKVRLDTKRPEGIAGQATFRINGASVRNEPVERAETLVSAGQGLLRVDKLDLRVGRDEGSVGSLTVPARALFAGDLHQVLAQLAGDFSLRLADVPLLLQAAGVRAPLPAGRLPVHTLTLAGRAGKGRIEVDQGRLVVEGGTVVLHRAALVLPAPHRSLAEAEVSASLGVDLPRLAPVASVFGLPPLEGSIEGRVEMEGTLGAPRGVAELRASSLEYGGTPLGSLSLRAQGDGRVVTIPSLELTRGPDRVSATGRVRVDTRRLEAVSLRVAIRDLGAYNRLIPRDWTIRGAPVRLKGSLEGRATVEGPLDAPDGTLEVEARDLTVQGHAFGAVSLRGTAGPRRIEVTSLSWRHDRDRISGHGGYDIGTRTLDGVSLQVAVRDLGSYLKAWFPEEPPTAGSVEGTLIAAGPLGEPTGRVDVVFKGVRVPGAEVESGVLRAASAGRRIRVETMELKTAQGVLSLSGTVTRSSAGTRLAIDVDSLAFSRRDATLRLARPAHLSFALPGTCTVEGLALSGDVGELRVDGRISTGAPSDLTITVARLKGGEWLDGWLGGEGVTFRRLDGRVHLWGTRAAPNATLAGTVAELTARDAPFPLTGSFDLGYTARGIEIRRFDWSGHGNQSLTAKGQVPIDPLAPEMLLPGKLSLEIEANVPQIGALQSLLPLHLATGGSLRTSVAVRGTWDAPVGHLELKAAGLNLPSSLKPAPKGPFAVDGTLDLQGREVTLGALSVHSAEASATGSGRWSGAPSLRELFRGRTDMTGEVEAKIDYSIADVSWAASAIPGIRRLGGKLDGEVRLTGPARRPDFAATARLSGGEVRPAADVPGVDSLNLVVRANQDGVRIEEARGMIGGAPFQVEGSVKEDESGNWSLDTRFRGNNVLLYRGGGVMVRADANLAVKGPVSRLAFTGGVAITEGRFARNIDILGALRGTGRPPSAEKGLQLFSIRSPPLKDAVFAIRISSKKPFEIRTGVATGALRPDLKLGGTGELPTLTGEVYVDSLKVGLPAGTLSVQSGVIRFLPGDPYRPRLDISATTTMMGYDITVAASGSYDQPQITLTSVPPLPDEDVILLLLAGQPPNTPASRTTAQRSGLNVAVYMGRNLLERWLGGESSAGGSILDRLEVQVAKEGVSQTGQETLDAQVLVAHINNKTVYITAQRDLYDAFNVGVKLVFRFK